LLFDVTWRRRKPLKSKAFWQIYLGYFILEVLLLSMLAYDALYRGFSQTLWGTVGAPTLVTLTVFVGLSILIARVMSKLPIKIENTNLGSFVMVLYISYAFFKLLSEGFNPLYFWQEASNVPSVLSPINMFFLISLPAIFSFILALVDVVITRRIKESHVV
jgi:hypothetical protein